MYFEFTSQLLLVVLQTNRPTIVIMMIMMVTMMKTTMMIQMMIQITISKHYLQTTATAQRNIMFLCNIKFLTQYSNSPSSTSSHLTPVFDVEDIHQAVLRLDLW